MGSGGYNNTTLVSGLCVTNTSFAGNIGNSGTISPSGIKFSSGTMAGAITSTGVINGGISLDSNSKITFGTTPINISGTSFGGIITNAGTISAAASGGVFGTGIWLHNLSSFSGDITNSGTIHAGSSGAGIFLGNNGVTHFTGDIVNSGVINGANGININGVLANGFSTGSVIGNITNKTGGTISTGYTGIYVYKLSTFGGSISNAGTISARSGLGISVYGVNTFTGSLINSGKLSVGNSGMSFSDGFTLNGGLTNTGTISAGGHGMFLQTTGMVTGSIVNAVGATIAAGSTVDSDGIGIETGFTISGSIFNGGLITSGGSGIYETGYDSVAGVTNAGTISVGGYNGILVSGAGFASVGALSQGLTNTGSVTVTGVNTLSGPHYGIEVLGFGTVAGGLTNATGATIAVPAGGSGRGIGIYIGADTTWSGGLTNAGTITASTGIVVANGISTFNGAVVNSGTITATAGPAIDLSAGPNNMTIDITAGAISGNMVGSGTSNGDTVNFTLGAGTFTYASTISGMHAVNLASGTLFDGGAITAGSVNINGGVLAPGLPHTISTLNITGNLVLASAAVYLDTISGANASKTAITEAATLGGASVQIAGGSTITGGTRYTILTDTLGGLGVGGNTFAGNVSYNGDAGTISYDPSGDDVYLTFAQSSTSSPSNLASLLPSSAPQNVVNVANAIDGYVNGGGTLPTNFQNLFNFTPGQLQTALTELDGEDATGAATGTFQLVDDFFNLLSDLALGTGGGGSSANDTATGFAEPDESPPPDVALAYRKVLKQSAPAQSTPRQDFEQRWTAWASGYGGGATYDGNATAGSNTLTASDYGYAGGMDYRAAPDLKLGFALAGGGTNWSLAQGLGGGRSDVFQAAGYGIKHYGPLYFTAMAAFGNSWFTTNRTAALGDQLRASFDGQDYALRGEAGYRYAVTPMAGLTPYAAIQTQWLHTPGYSETDLTGGGFALTYNAQTANDTRSEIGARADDLTILDAIPLILRARLAWAHDWVSGAALAPVFQALPGAAFTVNGAAVPHNSALVSAGGQLFFTSHWSFEAKFDGEFASSAQTYAGTGTLRYSW